MTKYLLLFLITTVFGFTHEGYLEEKEGQRILHIKGTPYERGFQHGSLLQEQIASNITLFLDSPKGPFEERVAAFKQQLPHMIKEFVPSHFLEEMEGLSDGANIPLEKIILLNLFPEMFHCSGMTFKGAATKDQNLYHVRVLEYSMGKTLQNTAVLMAVEPENGIAYLNLTYAGFIGTVTGMNQQKIAIGEIGGYGYGHWEGIPMAFLLREILERATTLEGAKKILEQSPRTCEYYYVISDGKTNDSFSAYATASQLHYLQAGDSYAILAPSHLPENYGTNGDHDKFFLSPCTIKTHPSQTLLFDKTDRLTAILREQPKDCLLLTGFSNAERYTTLVDRVMTCYGTIDEEALINIIKRPVSRDFDLHNAIFLPAKLQVWIAHASDNQEPACDQPYHLFSLEELITP